MEFIAKLKSEIVAELRAEIKAELIAEIKAELAAKPVAAKKEVAFAKPVVAKKEVKKPVVFVEFFKPADWQRLEYDTTSYKMFETWYKTQPGKYNHIRHSFNWLLKNEKYLGIGSDGTIMTNLRTWTP